MMSCASHGNWVCSVCCARYSGSQADEDQPIRARKSDQGTMPWPHASSVYDKPFSTGTTRPGPARRHKSDGSRHRDMAGQSRANPRTTNGAPYGQRGCGHRSKNARSDGASAYSSTVRAAFVCVSGMWSGTRRGCTVSCVGMYACRARRSMCTSASRSGAPETIRATSKSRIRASTSVGSCMASVATPLNRIASVCRARQATGTSA